jgi:signal peptidase I
MPKQPENKPPKHVDRTGSRKKFSSVAGSAVRVGIGFLILLLIMRTWFVTGLFSPTRLSSGSMATAFIGPHYKSECPECGAEYRFSADRHLGPKLICPKCKTVLPVDSLRLCDGERVIIDRIRWQIVPPKRWEPIVFYDPAQPTLMAIKRIVALPGESVQIVAGKVYIDGKRATKPFEIQKKTAVQIDPNEIASSWHSRPTGKVRWSKKEAVWAASNSEATTWLDLLPPEGGFTTRLDYNRSISVRPQQIGPVDELIVSMTIKPEKTTAGTVRFALNQRGGTTELSWDMSRGQVSASFQKRGSSDHKLLLEGQLEPIDRSVVLTISWIGQVLTFASDRGDLIEIELNKAQNQLPAVESGQNRLKSFSIGVERLGLELYDLAVKRDIYYTAAIGIENRWATDQPVKLGTDEYFVLGDNSSVSRDSRIWPQGPSIDGNHIIGRPLKVWRPGR